MKIRNLLSAAALSVGMFTSGAQAAVLDLTEVLHFSADGFASSMIHDQSKGRMRGDTVATIDSVISGGTYDTVSGAISFSGSITSGLLTSTFTAAGNLAASMTRTDGVFGNIAFSFMGDLFDGEVLDFLFADKTYTSGGEPNGLASDGTNDYIALWGDLGTFVKDVCTDPLAVDPGCYGIDLRIAYTEDPNPGTVVPLPASALLLLSGLVGLGASRKLRKKA